MNGYCYNCGTLGLKYRCCSCGYWFCLGCTIEIVDSKKDNSKRICRKCNRTGSYES